MAGLTAFTFVRVRRDTGRNERGPHIRSSSRASGIGIPSTGSWGVGLNAGRKEEALDIALQDERGTFLKPCSTCSRKKLGSGSRLFSFPPRNFNAGWNTGFVKDVNKARQI